MHGMDCYRQDCNVEGDREENRGEEASKNLFNTVLTTYRCQRRVPLYHCNFISCTFALNMKKPGNIHIRMFYSVSYDV